MKRITLKPQLTAEPIDAKTAAALDEAQASLARGEGMTLAESDRELENGYQEWLKSQKVPRSVP